MRRDLASRIDELETVGRRLTTLAASPHGRRSAGQREPRSATASIALEEARQELADIDLQAGLIRHA